MPQMKEQPKGVYTELEELREYKKRARFVMGKLHAEKEELEKLLEQQASRIKMYETQVMVLNLQVKNLVSANKRLGGAGN